MARYGIGSQIIQSAVISTWYEIGNNLKKSQAYTPATKQKNMQITITAAGRIYLTYC